MKAPRWLDTGAWWGRRFLIFDKPTGTFIGRVDRGYLGSNGTRRLRRKRGRNMGRDGFISATWMRRRRKELKRFAMMEAGW